MNEFPNEKKESLDLLRFFIRNYKVIGIAVIGSMVLSVIITFFIPNEYYSYGTIFPTSANSLEITLDNPSFGYDIEADRLIQILQSNEMQDIIIKKYNLTDYYDLDTTDNDWKDQLRKEFFTDISFTRNISMSVVISARTKDPILSANIVNTIIDTINPLRNKVIKKNFETAYLAFKQEYFDKKGYVDSMVEAISVMRDEIKDPQLIILSTQQTNLNMINNKRYQNSTKLELAINQYMFEQASLNEIAKRYYKAKLAWERPVPSVYVLDRANVSYKKVYPSYSLNLIIAGFGALILSWIILYLFEKIKTLKTKLN